MATSSIRMPRDRTALSILGIQENLIENNDVLQNDGWVYNAGNRVRKWFVRRANVRIWEPILDDIPRLEKRRWYVVCKVNHLIETEWRQVFELLEEVKSAAVFVPARAKWKKWYLSGEEKTRGLAWHWINSRPTNNKDDVGEFIMRVDQKLSQYGKYKQMFNSVLEMAFQKTFRENVGYDTYVYGTQFCFKVNNRRYYHMLGSHPLGASELQKIAWPDSAVIDIVL